MILALGTPHLPFIAAVHACAFPAAERWSAEAFATLLTTPGTQGWLDDRGAFILFRRAAGDADLLTLATHPDHRRQGLAAALLMASLRALADQNIERVFLEVAESNTPALGLYHRAGFQEVGRRAHYYPHGAAAIVMRVTPEAGADCHL